MCCSTFVSIVQRIKSFFVVLERLCVLLCTVCIAEVTANNSQREERAATKARELHNIRERGRKGFICVCKHVDIYLDVEIFLQQSIEIIPQLFKATAAYLVCWSPYHHCLSCYLKGESPLTGNFTVQLQYPLTVQSTIFLFQMKPQLPHCWVSTPLSCSLFFFRMLRHWVVVFSLLTTHRKCVVAKQVPVTVSTLQWGPQS